MQPKRLQPGNSPVWPRLAITCCGVAGEGTALPALPAELHNNTQYARIRLPDRVALLVWRLSRFMRLSFKRHFGGSALQSIDEFSMLAGLRFLERPTKTQLFHFELLETTTGLQMAARLQRAGLLSEAPHPTDARQKCLALSPTGQATLATAADTMDFIADELVGMLPDADLVLLEQMLAGINRVLTAARKT